VEDRTSSKCGELTVDGGNSSNILMDSSLTSRIRELLMFKETKTMRDKMSTFGRNTVV